MKHFSKLFFAALLSLASVKAFASGGPDAYGYTWTTSLDAGGPAYNWIDITSRPGVQSITDLLDDNSSASMISIGFPFHFYWNDYTQLKVGSNGWLSFNNVSNIASCFQTIPTAGNGDNLLAPLMGDLNFTGAGNPGTVKYWTNNVDSFIVSYINVPFWAVNAPGYAGSNSFQVILCSADSSIPPSASDENRRPRPRSSVTVAQRTPVWLPASCGRRYGVIWFATSPEYTPRRAPLRRST